MEAMYGYYDLLLVIVVYERGDSERSRTQLCNRGQNAPSITDDVNTYFNFEGRAGPPEARLHVQPGDLLSCHLPSDSEQVIHICLTQDSSF